MKKVLTKKKKVTAIIVIKKKKENKGGKQQKRRGRDIAISENTYTHPSKNKRGKKKYTKI